MGDAPETGERVVAIVQARMTSERLPGKVVATVRDRPMLGWVLRAAISARRVDEVVLATTLNATDEPILRLAEPLGQEVHRGSESDVLDRFHGALAGRRATHVVRLTADCPFLDPALIDATVDLCLSTGADYASTGSGFPRGLDVEVFTRNALEIAWREAVEGYHRSHVTSFIYTHPERFRLAALHGPGAAHERWTVDTAEDLAFARAVAEWLPRDRSPKWQEVMAVLAGNPEFRELNASVRQKALEGG